MLQNCAMNTIFKEKMIMKFQDNVIKEYLKNVYFVTGTACGGKTTTTKALAKKYNIPVYVIDEQFTIHQLKSDKEHQPNMNREFKDADEFFGRSVEEYQNWLLGNSREQLDYILLDLIRLSQDRIILCDLHNSFSELVKITDPSRMAFLIKEPKEIVEEYQNRPDHQPFCSFIHSATDYEKAKKTCNDTLYGLNIEYYNFIRNSDYFWIDRADNRTVDEVVELVEEHFGWNQPKNLEILKVNPGTELSQELLQFIENCSWNEVKEHVSDLVRNARFTDWETMFVAKADGKIIGMTSVMKEDYYDLPDVYPWVSTVFVSEEYRGHRVSEKMISFANEYLRQQGFRKSYIPSNHVGLYEHYGYTYCGEITNYGGGQEHLFVKEI